MNEVPLHVDPDLRLYVRELETKVEELERGIAKAATELEDYNAIIADNMDMANRLEANEEYAEDSHAALVLAKAWIEHDEGKSFDALKADFAAFRKLNGKPGYNREFVATVEAIDAVLAKNPAQSTTERSASAQSDREAGSTSAPGAATRVMHGGPADFQRTPHGSEGSASPLHPPDAALTVSRRWTMSEDGRHLFDEDFTHDVRLDVDGDWESDAQRIEWTKALAATLNAAVVPRVEPRLTGAVHYHVPCQKHAALAWSGTFSVTSNQTATPICFVCAAANAAPEGDKP